LSSSFEKGGSACAFSGRGEERERERKRERKRELVVVSFFSLLGAVHAAPGKPSFSFFGETSSPLGSGGMSLGVAHFSSARVDDVDSHARTRGHDRNRRICPPPQTLVGISPNKLSFGGEGPRRRQLTKSGQIQMRRVRGARGPPIRPDLALARSGRHACD
jgi:hypothetical protein